MVTSGRSIRKAQMSYIVVSDYNGYEPIVIWCRTLQEANKEYRSNASPNNPTVMAKVIHLYEGML